MVPDTARAPRPVIQELDKLANSRMLSEFARICGVSLSTLVNARNGKPISAETLQLIEQGMESRRRSLIPHVGVEARTMPSGEPMSRARLHAGIVHIMGHLSDLLTENGTLKQQLAERDKQIEGLQASLAEARVMLLQVDTAPAETLEPLSALAEVAQAAGPRHAAVMERLRDRRAH